MLIILGIMAGLIFLLYSVYFICIIKGDPEFFEVQILTSLSDFIITSTKASAQLCLWSIYGASVVVETLYFYLTMVHIQNPVMRIMTGLFILFEINHLLGIEYNLKRFFRGQSRLSQVFHWGRERSSAVLFFTHAFLVLAILLTFSPV